MFNLSTLILAAMPAIFLYSCSNEPIDQPVNIPPTISLISSSDITVEPEEVFTIDFSASKGSDSPLKAVTVYENDTKVPKSRLTINGAAATENPVLIADTDVDEITWTIDIVAQSSATTVVAFEVAVQDEAGEEQSIFVNVTAVGTPPDLTTTSSTIIETFQDFKNLFEISATKGSGDLVSIEIRENDQFVDPSKIFWQTMGTAVSENPFLLEDDDKGGFDDQELFIMTPASEGNFIYKVILTDAFGLTAQLEFDVTTL